MLHTSFTGFVRIATLALLASILCAGCCGESGELEQPPFENIGVSLKGVVRPVAVPWRGTKMGLVYAFAKAHGDRDIRTYEQCLHPSYQFLFCEDATNDPSWDWPDWIIKSTDVAVTENMFADPSVVNISAEFTRATEFYEDIDNQGNPYYWAEFVVDIHVLVDDGEEEIDLWVDGRALLYLQQDPNQERLWTIWRIEDLGPRHSTSERLSWSVLKALWR